MQLRADRTMIYEETIVKAGEIFDISENDERFNFFRINSSPIEKSAETGSKKPTRNKTKK